MSPKLRVAWFAPLNLAANAEGDSPSAYMSDVLLPILRRKIDIELFHAGYGQYRDYPTYNYLTAFKRHQEAPFDIFFYNLEDHARTNFVRCHLGLVPGVVYFHDYLLSTYGPEPILNSPYKEIVRRFTGKTTDWPARDGEFDRKGPFAVREAAYSLVSIFSNERNFNEWKHNREASLADFYPESAFRAFHLPYPVRPAETPARREKTVIYAGTPRIEHRAHKVLKAVAAFPDLKLIWLIDSAERTQAKELLGEFNVVNCELIEGRSPAAWEQLIPRASAALHTLFSVYGQVAPYLGISLRAGVPSLVTGFGASEYLPDNVVFKIQAGETESEEIRWVLKALFSGEASVRRELLQTFAEENYDSRKIASELLSIFENSAQFLGQAAEDWRKFQEQARRSLVGEVKGFLAGSNEYFESALRPAFREMGWE